MKKSIIIIALLALTMGTAKAQMFDFASNRYNASIGLNLGVVGYHFGQGQIDKTYADFGIGVNLSVAGLYLDFIYQAPEHRWGSKISPVVYNDHTALTINLGYKIPITHWLFFTPLVGYSNETTGWTDCSTINVDYENRSIYHDYDCETITSHFNYGAGLSARLFNIVEIGGVCTSHAVYGTIALSTNTLKNKRN